MPISGPAKAAMFSHETAEEMICLVTITHPDQSEGPFRFSNVSTTRISMDPLRYVTMSRGQPYYFMPFTIVLPESSQEAPGTVQLVVDNIDRELMVGLRSFPDPARFTIELVLSGTPDIVEISLFNLELLHATYNAEAINLSLGYESLMSEPFPWLSATPNITPGLFR